MTHKWVPNDSGGLNCPPFHPSIYSSSIFHSIAVTNPHHPLQKKAGALNVRRNIREVMDEKQLDASTLAAQRQESERLARVQEQQRIIREVRGIFGVK